MVAEVQIDTGSGTEITRRTHSHTHTHPTEPHLSISSVPTSTPLAAYMEHPSPSPLAPQYRAYRIPDRTDPGRRAVLAMPCGGLGWGDISGGGSSDQNRRARRRALVWSQAGLGYHSCLIMLEYVIISFVSSFFFPHSPIYNPCKRKRTGNGSRNHGSMDR